MTVVKGYFVWGYWNYRS